MSTSGSYADFLDALRQRESGNDYTIVNAFGFLGAYQFGEAALVDLGVVGLDSNPYDNSFDGGFTGKYDILSVDDFLGNSSAQDQLALEWFDLLWSRILNLGLEVYDQQSLNDTRITKTGLLAAAHLAGVGGVRDFIQGGGFDAPQDAFGTSLVDYLVDFSDFAHPTSYKNNLQWDNILQGGDGADTFFAVAGNDTVWAGNGDDFVEGGLGDDFIVGGDGSDLLLGDSVSADILPGLLAGLALL